MVNGMDLIGIHIAKAKSKILSQKADSNENCSFQWFVPK